MSSAISTRELEPRTTSRAGNWVFLAFTLPLIAVALWRIALFLTRVPIAAPFQFDYEEGNILNALSRILHGATPYPNPHALPNVINPYGPVAYYALAIPAKLFGLALLYPRLMILACAIAIAALIAFELRRTGASLAIASAIALVFLATPNVQQWMWLARVDLLGLFFAAAGLIVCSRELASARARPRILIPAVFFALALLVKISLLAAPAACFTALLARGRFRPAVALAAQTFAIFAAVMLVFAATTGGAVLTDVFFSHPDPFSFRIFTQALTDQFVASFVLVILAVIALARDLAQRRFSPAVLWILFATAGAVTAGKLGSNSNHFLEWNAALCLAAGVACSEFIVSRRALFGAMLAIAVVLAFQPVILPAPAMNAGCPQAYAWLRAHPGDILSENAGALVLANHQVWVSNPFVLAQEVKHAGWSDAELVNSIRARRFDAIFTGRAYTEYADYLNNGSERFSPDAVRALADNYTATAGFACLDMTVLYRPKPPVAIQSQQASQSSRP